MLRLVAFRDLCWRRSGTRCHSCHLSKLSYFLPEYSEREYYTVSPWRLSRLTLIVQEVSNLAAAISLRALTHSSYIWQALEGTRYRLNVL